MPALMMTIPMMAVPSTYEFHFFQMELNSKPLVCAFTIHEAIALQMRSMMITLTSCMRKSIPSDGGLGFNNLCWDELGSTCYLLNILIS